MIFYIRRKDRVSQSNSPSNHEAITVDINEFQLGRILRHDQNPSDVPRSRDVASDEGIKKGQLPTSWEHHIQDPSTH